jgi:hypothetical protein
MATDAQAVSGGGGPAAQRGDVQDIARALRAAWLIWIALVLLASAAFVISLIRVTTSPATAGSSEAAERWGWGVAAYLVIAFPAVLFWRSRRFHGYWHHRGVAPGTYLRGMSAMWVVLAIGALLGAIACAVTRTSFPNSALAAVAIVMMMTQWPKGNAMTRPVGNPGDVGTYQEPR